MPVWRIACVLGAVVALLLAAQPAASWTAWLPSRLGSHTEPLFAVGAGLAAAAAWRPRRGTRA